MNEDRAMTLMGILTAVMGLLSISVGKWIMGGIILLLAFGIFWNRGSGKFNDRSIYENIVKTDLSISELYERFKDIDTPLGRAWIGGHKGFEGDSIIFGPSVFKDCVIISRKKDKIDIKHITLVDNISRDPEDEYRFRDFIDPETTEVTPKRYSIFASLKIASMIMIRELRELVETLDKDRAAAVPDELAVFNFYYHNSSEGTFRDMDDNEILTVESSYSPFVAKVMDDEGNEMASVVPRAFNAKGVVSERAGFDIYADGQHFGEMSQVKSKGFDGFEAKTDAGTFYIRTIPACRRANVSANYTIEQDGVIKAVIGGSPNILFDTVGRCQNDVILSYDDDLIVLFAVLEIFIMTFNKKFLK